MTFPLHTKILIIDDMAAMRDLAADVLSQLGYHTFVMAPDGRHGLQALYDEARNGTPFHLVISDWNMPNMTGLELLKEVRKTPALASVPFILLTSENEQGLIIDAIKAGVNSYILKPISRPVLEMKLREVYTHLNKSKA